MRTRGDDQMTTKRSGAKVGAQLQVSSADSWSFAKCVSMGVWGEDTENSKSEIFEEKKTEKFQKFSENMQNICRKCEQNFKQNLP